jgi:hypothetical protein
MKGERCPNDPFAYQSREKSCSGTDRSLSLNLDQMSWVQIEFRPHQPALAFHVLTVSHDTLLQRLTHWSLQFTARHSCFDHFMLLYELHMLLILTEEFAVDLGSWFFLLGETRPSFTWDQQLMFYVCTVHFCNVIIQCRIFCLPVCYPKS